MYEQFNLIFVIIENLTICQEQGIFIVDSDDCQARVYIVWHLLIHTFHTTVVAS